jgi:hypothetical protein
MGQRGSSLERRRGSSAVDESKELLGQEILGGVIAKKKGPTPNM